MPTSAEIGKPWMLEQIIDINPTGRVIDVGPGAGAYAALLQAAGVHPEETVGVEIFSPYVATYDLESKYDRVIVADVRTWRWESADLVILGDVIEHMEKQDALAVVDYALMHADHVLVSLPVVVWEQGSCFGNDHEAHLHHWTDTEFRASFPTFLRASHVEPPIGCYRLSFKG